jgi:nucleoside-triphosphatase THEP1
MIKKNPEIEIDENDIFRNDKLNRKDSIEDLSKLIILNTEPLVLSINASWGSGKTTFVKLLQTYLKKECKVNSIYFSAWEDDFSKEPLISILGEMNSYIEKNFNVNTAVPKGFKKALNLSGKILKKVVPSAIKGATAGLIDAPQIVEDTISAISEESVKTLIENYSNDKNVLIEFKKAIEKVLKEMDEEKPFVIFIDELDRCRPLYSIELLERIKHVFGIKRLIFVLSIDKSQLSESIKSQYGNINANSYLKRFIDLEYSLTNSNLDDFCDFLYLKFDLENLLESKGIEIERKINFHHLSVMKKLAQIFNLSLRDMEQIFTKISIIFKTIEPKSYTSYFRIFILFEMLKSYDSELYYDFINRKHSITRIKEIIQLDKFRDENIYNDVGIILEAVIDSTRITNEELNQLVIEKESELNLLFESVKEKKRVYEENMTKNNQTIYVAEDDKYKKLAHSIKILNTNFNDWGDYRLNNLIDNVIKKIEFTDKFNFETV